MFRRPKRKASRSRIRRWSIWVKVPYTHPNEKMCSNAKPFKRYIGPPHFSEEGKVGGHKLGAPPTRRKEAEAVRWVDVAWSKRQNARTSSAIGQHIIPNQEAASLLPLAGAWKRLWRSGMWTCWPRSDFASSWRPDCGFASLSATMGNSGDRLPPEGNIVQEANRLVVYVNYLLDSSSGEDLIAICFPGDLKYLCPTGCQTVPPKKVCMVVTVPWRHGRGKL